MHEWLHAARTRLAEKVGADVTSLDLTDGDVTRILELARVAAHDSGDRTNAPLLTYLVGLIHGRHPERTLAELAAPVISKPS